MEKNLTLQEILTLSGIFEKIIKNITRDKIMIPLDLHYKLYFNHKALILAEDFIFQYFEGNKMLETMSESKLLTSVVLPINLFEINKNDLLIIEEENILKLDKIDLYEFKTILS